ncbi:peptidase inhibitor family I36 protein [Nocardia sp. NPDC004604]|uniref:peptidase inhibitor family I36 protein n=1 Tax=Nocardia sp. NPDC004604 TaxID=3157013 RepID=UPI0033AA893B
MRARLLALAAITGLACGIGVSAVPASADADSGRCPGGAFCLWSGAGYTGTIAQTAVPPGGRGAGQVAINPTRSVVNNTSYVLDLYENPGGGGRHATVRQRSVPDLGFTARWLVLCISC